jgi:type I restriction enzyme R subunit
MITDAIRDENILKYPVAYLGRYKKKAGGNTRINTGVKDIETKTLLK